MIKKKESDDDNLYQQPINYPHPEIIRNLEVQNEVKASDPKVPANCRFRKSLKKVLLAINFNFIFYKLIPTLREFYTPHFRKVVFCGPEEDVKYGHIIKMNSKRAGREGYHCLAKAIEFYHLKDGSDFDGYFYSNDDVMLNFWTLNEDTNKIWLGDTIVWRNAQDASKPLRKGSWWPANTPRCKRILNKLGNDSTANSYVQNYYRNILRNFYNKTIAKDQLPVYDTKQERRICVKSWSDAFYIPARYADGYVRLANMFEAEKLFLEIASPMIHNMLEDSTQMLNMNGIYHVSKNFGFYGTYSFNSTFSHPFKLGDGTNMNFFKNVIVPYSQHITNECKLENGN